MPRKKEHATCTVPGCTRPHRAQGLCWAHYQRARRKGSPGRPQIGAHAGDTVRCEVQLPLKVWERLAGQGRPFSEIAREALERAAARLPQPSSLPLYGLRSTACNPVVKALTAAAEAEAEKAR